MPKLLAAASLILLLINSHSALGASADERAQASIDTRQGLFKVVVSYFGPIVGMAREQIPYDAEVVKNNAAKIATLLPMAPDLFRHDTSAFDIDTEALEGIWDDLEDFNAKATTATEKAQALSAAAEDQGAAMKAFGELGASCKGCHDQYRQQD